MPDAPRFPEGLRPKLPPDPRRERLVEDLGREKRGGRSSQFNQTLFGALTAPENHDVPLADVWQQVEDGFAAETRTKSRKNPYREDE